MGELELNKLDNKGFTLIELLVAILIILVASLGLMKGILEYEKFSIRGKMKTQATQILENMISEIAKYSYPANNTQSILHANHWTNQYCNDNNCTDCCDFENDNVDNDDIPDFYDPYTGEPNYNNPLSNLNPNFRLKPSGNDPESICSCIGSNCPSTNLPLCTYKGYSGRNIYAAVNVAEIKDSDNPSRAKGRFASVVVWYFEPFTNKLQHMSAVIFKSVQEE